MFLYDNFDEKAFFFELEGDHRKFHNVFINAGSPKGLKASKKDVAAYNKTCDELQALVYEEDTGVIKVVQLEEPTRDWTYFVHCGFVP